jgi:hypothetical protein
MPNYFSKKVKTTPNSGLSTDRHLFLNLEQAEPNLGYPGEKYIQPVPNYYNLASIDNSTLSDRFWVNNNNDILTVNGISIFKDNTLVGTANSINKINFKGNIINASASGNISTITGTVNVSGSTFGQLVFINNNDFTTSSKLSFSPSVGILTVSNGLSVDYLFSSTINGVSIGSEYATEKLYVNGNALITNNTESEYLISENGDINTINATYLKDSNDSIGSPNQILTSSISDIKFGLRIYKYEGYFGDSSLPSFDTSSDNVNYVDNLTPVEGPIYLSEVNQFNIDSRIDNITSNSFFNNKTWLISGYFLAPKTGRYTFYTNSDDGSYLWIDDNAIEGYTKENALVKNGGKHPINESNGSIFLNSGVYYPIRVLYGNQNRITPPSFNPTEITISFSGPGIAKRTNGYGYFFSTFEDLTSENYQEQLNGVSWTTIVTDISGTWGGQTGIRTDKVTFVNTTGSLLYVSATPGIDRDSQGLTVGQIAGSYSVAEVDGIEVARTRDNGTANTEFLFLNVDFFVPNGSSYIVKVYNTKGTQWLSSITTYSWSEFNF